MGLFFEGLILLRILLQAKASSSRGVITMANRMSVDVEVAPRAQIAKKTMWQSIFANPKVIFIAFFAS